MRAAIPVDGAETIALEEIAVPEPGPGQALVRIRAAGMNRADLLHAKGTYSQALRSPKRPNVAGMELAGQVVTVGPQVDPGLAGTDVMAMFPGAYADYAVVDHRLLLPAPAGLGWSERAALPMALLTEFEALARLAGLQRGERVLVTGATSGVGLVGVQLARYLGAATVVATSRDAVNDELLTSLGADAVAHDAEELARLLPDGVDVVVDHVGGRLLASSLPLLLKHGRVVSVGRLGGRTVELDLAAFSAKRASLIGTTWKSQGVEEVAASVATVGTHVLDAVARGEIRAVVAQEFALDDIADAYRVLAKSRPPGKLVILNQPPREV